MSTSQKPRILVVDDNEMNAELLLQELEDAGYHVVVAHDGATCLARLADETFQAVVLDVMMPNISGLEVLAEIRKTQSRTQLPVVMATARTQSDDIVAALDLGANDYVTKPIDMAVLLARLRVLVAVGSTHQPAAPRSSRTFRELAQTTDDEERQHTDTWCATCGYCVMPGVGICGDCGATPDGEFPEIPRDVHPLLGTTIDGRYFLDREIGHGGFGRVYRALELDIERFFAAKVLNLGAHAAQTTQDTRSQAINEVRALAKLRSPHVVQVFEVVMAGADHCAAIMEYVDGMDLKTALNKYGPMPPATALEVVRQVATGLHAVHEMKFVHCDVKPSNIVLQTLPGGRYFAKLVDFGIAQLDGSVSPDLYAGTPAYSAPEQLAGAVTGPAADVYALAMVLWCTLTGKSPYVATDLHDLAAQKELGPPDLTERLGTTPFAMAANEMLSLMAHPIPDLRIPSMAEVIQHLEVLMQMPNLETRSTLRDDGKAPSDWHEPTIATAISTFKRRGFVQRCTTAPPSKSAVPKK
jgi:CheY-like chemotaxis protein